MYPDTVFGLQQAPPDRLHFLSAPFHSQPEPSVRTISCNYRVCSEDRRAGMCLCSTFPSPRQYCRGVSGPGLVAGRQFSLWDQFLVRGREDGREEMTVEELLKHVKDKHSLTITGLYYGPAVLYADYCDHADRLKRRVSDVVRAVTKMELPAEQRMLEIIPSFAEDEDCEKVPPIRYLLS
ncbi:hypothetical protein NFI96_027994 [Prochilodus magdalenae]|nr:hypothetical protein NFI96_027994 [Prochilodus magdalenae]